MHSDLSLTILNQICISLRATYFPRHHHQHTHTHAPKFSFINMNIFPERRCFVKKQRNKKFHFPPVTIILSRLLKILGIRLSNQMFLFQHICWQQIKAKLKTFSELIFSTLWKRQSSN